ncbi:MAG: bestrophin family ion channel [Planctomycetota bacterium]
MMVLPKNLPWWLAVLHLRCSALDKIWLRLLFAAVFAVVVTAVYDFKILTVGLTTTPFALIGLALSIFLGFRNNASYERFWEGRKLWGRLVNTSRSVTRQVLNLPVAKQGEEAELRAWQETCVRTQAAYVHSLRLWLRGQKDLSELGRLLPGRDLGALAATSNPPIALLQTLGERFREAWKRGWVDTYHLPVLEDSLTQLTDIQGGCERIKNTPIPVSYSLSPTGSWPFTATCLGLFETVGEALTPLVVLLCGLRLLRPGRDQRRDPEPLRLGAHDLRSPRSRPRSRSTSASRSATPTSPRSRPRTQAAIY